MAAILVLLLIFSIQIGGGAAKLLFVCRGAAAKFRFFL